MTAVAETDFTELDLEAFSNLVYAMRHRVASPRPGNHASRSPGSMGRFAGLYSVIDEADVRRLDLRASIADPFETVWIRRYQHAASGPVQILLDLSGSMGFEGTVSRRDVAVALAAGLTKTAIRAGDKVGVHAATGDDPDAYILRPTRRASAAAEVAAALREVSPKGAGLAGLVGAISAMPQSPSLVFLISDFAAPIEQVRNVLDALAMHDVRPIIVRDPDAEMPPSRFGLAQLADLESGARGMVFLRPSLLEEWGRRREAHARALSRLFFEFGCRPLHVTGQIDLDDLAEAMMTGGVPI
ncbi:hypothetical protein [Fulvimarina sp. MAC8]|uniref:DUF58 domain-containing protein n=1 Tax=Fulvimarina sp. MAC8 TaxID=3162874 RepID=UPI0032EB5E4B